MTILDKILAVKRTEIEAARAARPWGGSTPRRAPPGRSVGSRRRCAGRRVRRYA
jgi:hypothetical protein